MSVKQMICYLLIWCISFVNCERLLQTVTATIGGENYTHYRLSTQGRLLVILESVIGDADLYISDHTLSPTYDDFVIQSNTCGNDQVEISSHLKRPVGIAVYGHPNYENTEYKLSIYYLAAHDDVNYAELTNLYNKMDGVESSEERYTSSQSQYNGHGGDQEEGESFWSIIGTILSTVLKIIFEVLL